MPFTYTPDMPVASHFPSADQPIMNANSQYLKDFGNRDHEFTQNSSTPGIDGYHKQVTFATNQTTPGFTSGVAVEYVNTANTASQLFFSNGGGNIQLTVIKAASGSDKAVPFIDAGPPYQAVTFLPGGMLIQFGNTTANTVTFPCAFKGGTTPSVSFSVTATTGGTFPIVAPSNTNFTITGKPVLATMYWTAIGEA